MLLLTVKQVAERLGCCPGTVYLLCAAGKLMHRRVGLGRGRIRVSEEDLAAYLAAAKVEGLAQPRPTPPPLPYRLKHLRPA